MANDVKFEDYSINVKAALDDVTLDWLIKASSEVESHAKRNCKMDGQEGTRLRGSYQSMVDESKGEAIIGSPLESVYWEEFGTGEHAVDTSKSRKGWWVYIDGGSGYEGPTGVYSSREEAEMMAAHIREKYGENAVATNGRDPQYTLQKAFDANREKAQRQLETLLKERMNK